MGREGSGKKGVASQTHRKQDESYRDEVTSQAEEFRFKNMG